MAARAAGITSAGVKRLPLATDTPPPSAAAPWLGAGFRPMFLSAAASAVLPLVVFLLALSGWSAVPSAWAPPAWHAHEMLFGFAGAAVGGFLLTAVPNWTKSRPLSGRPLLALFAAWLVGRLACSSGDALPGALVAALDLLYLPGLLLAVTPAIVRARAPRQYPFPALLLALWGADLAFHLTQLGSLPASWASPTLHVALSALLLVLAIVGGRVVPAFTTGALRRAGSSDEIPARPRLHAATLVCLGAALVAQVALPPTPRGVVACLAAALLLTRLLEWRGHRALRMPIVWVLHVGWAFLAGGVLLVGLSDLGVDIPPTSALHLLTAGAVGTMVLAIMSRASLGHTGRPLEVSGATTVAYVLVITGTLVRALGPAIAPDRALEALTAGGATWAAGFAIFFVVYAPMLVRPRADGKPG